MSIVALRKTLTAQEKRLRATLIGIVQDAENKMFAAVLVVVDETKKSVSLALAQLKEQGLYEDTHPKDWDGFCMFHFGFGYKVAWRKMNCAQVEEDMSPAGNISDAAPLLNERQARALIELKTAEARQEVFSEAVEEVKQGKRDPAPNGQPTADHIKEKADAKRDAALTPTERKDKIEADAGKRAAAVQRLDDDKWVKWLAKFARKLRTGEKKLLARGGYDDEADDVGIAALGVERRSGAA
jgi:hypothetical protein